MLNARITRLSIDRVIRGHQQLAAETDRAMREVAEFGGRFAVDHVAKHPEFQPQTGNLQRKTKARVARTRSGHVLKLSNSAKYASAIEHGARPHDIVARKGAALKFRGTGGAWVFRRRVRHPGNKAYRFLYRATNATYRVTGRNLSQRLRSIASRF